MESFFFFFNLINKSLILNFVMLRKEEEEGEKATHGEVNGYPLQYSCLRT